MKRLFALIALLGLLGTFAGCSNDNSGGGGTMTPTNAPAAPGTNAAK